VENGTHGNSGTVGRFRADGAPALGLRPFMALCGTEEGFFSELIGLRA
jgi:hypothetical protein